MLNLKNEKGSITLFVLVSCMFFITAVVCAQMYTQSKKVAVDREYKQIKSNYEKDLDNMENIYQRLAKSKNLVINFSESSVIDSAITVGFSLDTTNLYIKSIKYGWLNSKTELNNLSSENIQDWVFVENTNGNNEIEAIKNNIETDSYYYLCVVVNGQEVWMPSPIVVEYNETNKTWTIIKK